MQQTLKKNDIYKEYRIANYLCSPIFQCLTIKWYLCSLDFDYSDK